MAPRRQRHRWSIVDNAPGAITAPKRVNGLLRLARSAVSEDLVAGRGSLGRPAAPVAYLNPVLQRTALRSAAVLER